MAFAQLLRTALAALLIAAFTWPAHALQLGDTKAHILARHGTPTAEDVAKNLVTYSWEGWTAQVAYQDGLVEKLTYRKSIPLQEVEIVSLLQSNGGRQRWREATPSDGVRRWERDDGAVAEFNSGESTGMAFCRTRMAETIWLSVATSVPTAAPVPAAAQAPATIRAQTVAAAPAPAPTPKAAPIAAQVVAVPPASTPAATSTRKPIVTSGLNLEPIFALPNLSNELPTLTVPKIETPPAPVETFAHVAALPRPKPLVVEELFIPEKAAAAEAESPKLVELKPAVRRELKFRVSSSRTPGPAVPVPAPGEVANGILPSGSGVVAAFVLLTGLISGVALSFRKRLASAPHELPLNSVPRASIEKAPAAASIPALDALRWDHFELLVAETYRREDYIVEISAGVDAEAGTDLTLRRDSETFLVQCKHWKTACVAEREVREFYGMMAATGAPQGIVATLGTFSREARTFAAEKGIELLDRVALEKRVEAMARPDEDFCTVGDWIEEFVAHARIFDPECPVCNGSMIIRQSRVGGAASWGCRSYPRCPGKREPRPDLLAVTAGR